ncbi:MAG: glycosyltransferase [Planctomycetota bacterium]
MAEPLHALHVFSTFLPAGPQVRACLLMDALGDAYRHTVVATDNRTEAASLLRRAEARIVDWAPGSGPMSGARFTRELLRDERPDLLLTYNWGAMDAVIAARAARFDQHVHHEDGFNADEKDGLKARRNWARRVSLRSTDVVVPSENLARIARRTWRLPRVHLVPNGIDADRFARDEAAGRAFRAEHGIEESTLVIGAVGHLRPIKNLVRLVRAAAAAPFEAPKDIALVICGEGPERPAIEDAADEAKGRLRVVLPGHLADLVPAYSAFDVLAISSDSEQQPVSLLEAMAAGVPVAATGVGDVAVTLPAEARAHVVPLGEHVERDLGLALARLAADSELRTHLAELGRARVRESYSLEAMVAAYGELYARAAAR